MKEITTNYTDGCGTLNIGIDRDINNFNVFINCRHNQLKPIFIEDTIRTIRNSDLITNFKKRLKPLYKQAIKIYEWKTGDYDNLFITEDAYWSNGEKDETLNALRLRKNRDLTYFWKVYKKLEQIAFKS